MITYPVKGAPNAYQLGYGVIQQLKELTSQQQLLHGFLIHGDKSWEAAKPFIPEVSCTKESYQNRCTKSEVERLSQVAKNASADYIIGVGGGTICDLAKAVGNQTGLPVFLIPTLASNCAPWTPLSVFYTENGDFDGYEIFSTAVHQVLIDPALILTSPKDYLSAGIGDTIAKWYEADVLSNHLNEQPLSLDIALHAAKICRDELIKNGEKALVDHEKGNVTNAYVRVIETIILAGGMVGGFGEKYGRIAAAHAVHNGLTHLKETSNDLHGNKVAYGILVQLALENNLDEIRNMRQFYSNIGLPTKLKDLNITEFDEEMLYTVAKATVKPGESIHLMGISDASDVVNAIKTVESINQEK
ncbi:iron-containing alcohol dehydrogenase family protein [Halalkalibacillus halophilus]|uniref:iron-containing alcohol dehydrogenase family protein n=1 Tax=Halalkalibacillus halophilus TaxID=392827 RepID=UPI00042973B6|nr:iron-containing alcohol dehydrogenase family protein [Halalkalibacillus halophilus]